MKLTEEKLNYYLGDFVGCYYGYSANKDIRNNAASGGLVSTILVDLLEQNKINGGKRDGECNKSRQGPQQKQPNKFPQTLQIGLAKSGPAEKVYMAFKKFRFSRQA